LDTPVSVSNTADLTEIRMGDPYQYVTGYKTYDLSYRMSPPIFRDVFSVNLIGTNWDEPLNNITFSITFPKPFDPSTIQVFAGPFGTTSLSEACSYESWNDTVSGECSTLWKSALTVTLPINRVYFIPTTPQLYVLIIGSVLLLFLSIYLIHFCWAFMPVDINEPPFLTPTQASQLLFGEVNPQIELLYFASQGKVRLTRTNSSEIIVTFSQSASESNCAVLPSPFAQTQSYSGNELKSILCRDDVSKQAERELREQGYIFGNCCTFLCWLTFLIPFGLPVTELTCAYQTIVAPILLSFLITFVFLCLFCSCKEWYFGDYSIYLYKFEIAAFVFCVISIGVGFGLYFDRPILWDTFQGIILGGLASTLIAFGIVFRLNWTTAGTRVAAGILAYRNNLKVEEPPNENDESEVWR
jgi:hypothetical protein